MANIGAFRVEAERPLGQSLRRMLLALLIVAGVASGIEAASAATQSESASYERAVAFLRAGNTAVAMKSFGEYLATFPHGPHAASALYWIGDMHLVARDYIRARAAFDLALRENPPAERAASLLLKLSYAQIALGDRNAEVRSLRRLVSEFPGSEAARVGGARLAQINSIAASASAPRPNETPDVPRPRPEAHFQVEEQINGNKIAQRNATADSANMCFWCVARVNDKPLFARNQVCASNVEAAKGVVLEYLGPFIRETGGPLSELECSENPYPDSNDTNHPGVPFLYGPEHRDSNGYFQAWYWMSPPPGNSPKPASTTRAPSYGRRPQNMTACVSIVPNAAYGAKALKNNCESDVESVYCYMQAEKGPSTCDSAKRGGWQQGSFSIKVGKTAILPNSKSSTTVLWLACEKGALAKITGFDPVEKRPRGSCE
jgi:Tfp pilus assembly protein PilF